MTVDIKTTKKIRFVIYALSMLAVVSIFSYNDQISSVIAADVSDADVVDVTAVVPSPNAPGGGGGTGSIANSSVRISGAAFPHAKLTLLKDGQVTTTLIASADGSFVVLVNGLNFGTYQFSIFAEDRDGVTSAAYTINVPIYQVKTYTYSGVVIPPTISTNLATVGPNQTLVVYGYAPANSTVLIDVPNRFNLGSTNADLNGFYRFEVRDRLAAGTYDIRSRVQVGSIQSMFSKPVTVTYYVGSTQPPTVPPQYSSCVDYNKDRRINLIDFSILLFWFNKENPPRTIDCNADNRIDIKDFSILMYFWTG